MHSSRMRTARSLTVSRSICWRGHACHTCLPAMHAPLPHMCPFNVLPVPHMPPSTTHAPAMHTPCHACPPATHAPLPCTPSVMHTPLPCMPPAMHAPCHVCPLPCMPLAFMPHTHPHTRPPPPRGQTDTCENITAVKMDQDGGVRVLPMPQNKLMFSKHLRKKDCLLSVSVRSPLPRDAPRFSGHDSAQTKQFPDVNKHERHSIRTSLHNRASREYCACLNTFNTSYDV